MTRSVKAKRHAAAAELDEKEIKKKKKRKRKKNANKEIVFVSYVFVALFLAFMAYFVYFINVDSKEVIKDSHNGRFDTFASSVVRGKILSSDGAVLAEMVTDDSGEETRSYPYGAMYAHVVGYSTRGKTGVESLANINLLESHMNGLEQIYNRVSGNKNIGDNVVTTLNSTLQSAAYSALGDYQGAIVAMNVETGEILAMVSKPDFDPNQINEIWDSLTSEENTSANLVNRATQGLYPPGSTFKVMTALEYMRENPDTYQDYVYDCIGSYTRGEYTIRCIDGIAHGTLNFNLAFAKSCNSAFMDIGLMLNMTSFAQTCQQMLFNSELPCPLTYKQSSFVLDESSSEWDIMQTSMGQGETLMTPYHGMLIAAAVANGGSVVSPYLLERVENGNGELVSSLKEEAAYTQLMSEEEAAKMTELMAGVTSAEGTAAALQSVEGYQVYGKTGTAEYVTGEDDAHGWFLGFADNGTDKIAICVILENGAGNSLSALAAKTVFDAYYNN